MDLTASIGLHLTAAELPGAAERIAAELAELAEQGETASPDLRLAAGMMSYFVADFPASRAHLEAAYLGFKRASRPRRAALAATQLSWLHYEGIGNAAVGQGWIARAHRLLAPEGDCVEAGWAALPVVGCGVADADELDRNAERALKIARQLDDVDLECKALADSGLALVSRGELAEGTRRIDEAMTMASSGECDNVLISGQVRCSLISACGRTGDLPRLEAWLSVVAVEDPFTFGPDAPPNLLLNHCQSEYGSLLCQAGRWSEADVTLQHAVRITDAMHFGQRALSRAALAALRIDQGRVAEAAGLLNGLEQRAEAQLALIRLHHARGDHDLAAAVARQALRMMGGDRLRAAPIYAVLVEAELGRGNLDGACDGARELAERAAEAPLPPVAAMAARAAGQVAAASGDLAGAARRFEQALRLLPGDEWSMLAGAVHLDLASLLAGTDRGQAIAEARRALAIFGRIGAHRMHAAQALLHELGDASACGVTEPECVRALTPREREILQLLAQGLSNPQIAQRLVISPKTAEHHVGAILRKLQLTSRSEAAVYAATLAAKS